MQKTRKPTNDTAISIQDRKTVYQGFFRLDAYRLQHKKYDGSWTNPLTREIFMRTPTAAVLPYDPWQDRIVLIEQFRFPAYLAGLPAWHVEIPAGIVEDGESPEGMVMREAKEEAGLEIEVLEKIAEYLPSPGACSEKTFLYLGCVNADNVEGIFGVSDEEEDIKATTLSTIEAFQNVDKGLYQNAATLISLLWLRLNHEGIREKWRADKRAG